MFDRRKKKLLFYSVTYTYYFFRFDIIIISMNILQHSMDLLELQRI